MDLYKYLCFILLTTVCYIDADIEITKELYTWAEATQVCTLATPNLTFSESGITPEVANLPAEAWLGYTEKMTQFEYFGCAKKDGKDGLDLTTTADYTTEGDPGKCWSACNNGRNVEAIAVNGNKCYCLHNVNFTRIELKKDKCNKKCPGQPKIVCGDGGGHVSLYKTTYTEPIMGNYPEGYICLWYDSNTKSFFWGNCTEYNLMICYDDNGEWVYNATDENSGWITLTTKCFNDGERHGTPSNYSKTMELVTMVTAEMWTGIIRNNVIYPITKTTNANVDKYGYADSATGKLFVTTDKTVEKKALCVEGTVTTKTTSSTNKTTTSSDKKLLVQLKQPLVQVKQLQVQLKQLLAQMKQLLVQLKQLLLLINKQVLVVVITLMYQRLYQVMQQIVRVKEQRTHKALQMKIPPGHQMLEQLLEPLWLL